MAGLEVYIMGTIFIALGNIIFVFGLLYASIILLDLLLSMRRVDWLNMVRDILGMELKFKKKASDT